MPNILKGVTQYEKHRVTPHQTQFSKHQRGYLEAIKILLCHRMQTTVFF